MYEILEQTPKYPLKKTTHKFGNYQKKCNSLLLWEVLKVLFSLIERLRTVRGVLILLTNPAHNLTSRRMFLNNRNDIECKLISLSAWRHTVDVRGRVRQRRLRVSHPAHDDESVTHSLTRKTQTNVAASSRDRRQASRLSMVLYHFWVVILPLLLVSSTALCLFIFAVRVRQRKRGTYEVDTPYHT